MARFGPRLRATVIVVKPSGVGLDWAIRDAVPVLRTLRAVEVVTDEGGDEAERFGARTSGHVLLYSPRGALLFSGGITRTRGQEGPSTGQDALVNAILRSEAATTTANVFGCGLRSPDAGVVGKDTRSAREAR